MSQSKHSRRSVPRTRSQRAFAFGLLGGLFNTRSPSRWMDSSSSAEKMLPRPLRGRMRCHVKVNQSTAVMLDNDEHVQDSEGAGHCDTEVTRDDRLRMITTEGRPSLAASRSTRGRSWHVLAHRAS